MARDKRPDRVERLVQRALDDVERAKTAERAAKQAEAEKTRQPEDKP